MITLKMDYKNEKELLYEIIKFLKVLKNTEKSDIIETSNTKE